MDNEKRCGLWITRCCGKPEGTACGKPEGTAIAGLGWKAVRDGARYGSGRPSSRRCRLWAPRTTC